MRNVEESGVIKHAGCRRCLHAGINFIPGGTVFEENWQTRGMHRLFGRGRYSTRRDTGVVPFRL